MSRPRSDPGLGPVPAGRHSVRPRLVVCLCLASTGYVSAAVSSLTAQVGPAEPEAFLAAVEMASRRFEHPDSAMAEGYRRLGPDFPGMGEHWIHPSLVIAGALDPERPPVVSYTTVGSEPRLIGVAFTRVLRVGDGPPPGPFPASAWHDHTGGVDEESLLLSGPASMHHSAPGFRLAMVHVWIRVPNPDGVFAQNNWALPFLRAGLVTPERVSSSAARALSLAGVGEAFYEELLREGVSLRGEALTAALAAFARAGDRSRAWLAASSPAAEVTRDSVDELEAIWSMLWRELDLTVSADARERLAVLRK